MFSPPLRTSVFRARPRSVWLAAIVGLLASGSAVASAQASTPALVTGEAVIASASGTTIDTTSGASGTPANRSTSASGSGTITLNSSAPTLGGSTEPASKPSSARQIGGSALESPIVGSTSRRQAAPLPRAALTQLQSGGPLVASSGTPARATDTARRVARAPVTASLERTAPDYARTTPAASTTTVEINVKGVQLYISPTSARRPTAGDTRASAPDRAVGQLDTSGSGLAGFLPGGSTPAPAPAGPGNTALFGSASGSAGGSSLLGIDSLLTIAALIVGAAWRRRSWDLPVLARQSALLSLALDRPG